VWRRIKIIVIIIIIINISIQNKSYSEMIDYDIPDVDPKN